MVLTTDLLSQSTGSHVTLSRVSFSLYLHRRNRARARDTIFSSLYIWYSSQIYPCLGRKPHPNLLRYTARTQYFMHENSKKKLNGSVSPQNLQKAPKTPIARPSITPILRMDQVSSIYNPGNDFFWREEGPCRARARTSPARPSLGVPPTRFRGNPVTLSGQTRLNLQVPGALGQPAWFAPIGWTGTSRSQVGVPPRMSTFLIWQQHSKYKKSLYRRHTLGPRVRFSS